MLNLDQFSNNSLKITCLDYSLEYATKQIYNYRGDFNEKVFEEINTWFFNLRLNIYALQKNPDFKHIKGSEILLDEIDHLSTIIAMANNYFVNGSQNSNDLANALLLCPQKLLNLETPELSKGLSQREIDVLKFIGSSLSLKEHETIKECHCPKNNRLNTTRRAYFERMVIKDIIEKLSSEKGPLKIASIGSGGALSDFIIVSKLLEAGFKIEYSLIDISYEDCEKVKNNFLALFGNEFQDEFTLKVFSSTKEFHKKEVESCSLNERHHCIIMEDFDNPSARNNLHKELQEKLVLRDNGMIFDGLYEDSNFCAAVATRNYTRNNEGASEKIIDHIAKRSFQNENHFGIGLLENITTSTINLKTFEAKHLEVKSLEVKPMGACALISLACFAALGLLKLTSM